MTRDSKSYAGPLRAAMAATSPRRPARRHHAVGMLFGCFLLGACAASPLPPLALEDRAYGPTILSARGTELGIASWYGPGFHGKQTATGERYDQHGMTAAHRTLPLGTRVEVRDMRTDSRVTVRINDRGPYKRGRSIDLSYAAAKRLGIVERGTTPVEIRLVDTTYENWPRIVYSVQLGAFGQRAIADRLGHEAADHGYRSYLKLVRDKPLLYGVRVGPYENRGAAKRVQRSLSRDGFDVALVEEDPIAAGYLLRGKSPAVDVR